VGSFSGKFQSPPSHATDKPADTKRCESRGVWTLFDETADIVLSIDGALAHHLGGIRGRLFCLAIEILGRPCCLVDEPIGLAFRVARDAANTFLHFGRGSRGFLYSCRTFHCAAIKQGCRLPSGTRAVVRKVAKIFQRIWRPLIIGAMFMLEVVWILFLVYAFMWSVLPGGR
jgi:hypothetical protein